MKLFYITAFILSAAFANSAFAGGDAYCPHASGSERGTKEALVKSLLGGTATANQTTPKTTQ